MATGLGSSAPRRLCIAATYRDANPPMQLVDTDSASGFFDVIGGTERSQAATMILDAGESTGGPTNRHPNSDQWLFVKSGTGTATVDGGSHGLQPGVFLLIEAGETHEITNDGDRPLETINVYAPPVY